MRFAAMAATVGGFAAVASGQSNFSFQSVFENHVEDGATNIYGLQQVVLFDNDHVAALAAVGENADDGIIYSAPNPTHWDSSVIVKGQDPLWDGRPGAFNFLHNIAVTSDGAAGTRIHFVARASGVDFGLFQYTVGGGADALFEGDPYGDLQTFNHVASSSYVSYQVNAQGQMVLAGKVGSRDVLLRMDGASIEEMANNALTPAAEFAVQSHKRVIAPGGRTLVTVHDQASGADPVWDALSVSTPGGPVTSVLPPSFFDEYVPELVHAANDTHAILRARKADNSYSTILTNGATYAALASFTPGPASAERLQADAVLTGNGRAAFYTPDADNDVTVGQDTGSLLYVDLNGSATPTLVAGVGTDLGDGWTIRDLTVVPGVPTAPMINDNGVIVFDARIGNQPGDDDFHVNNWRSALLAWSPDGGLQIVAREGGVITIDGVEVTIQQLMLNPLSPSFDGGLYKDGLNNQNRLAFGVVYADSFESEEINVGVVITTVPEPTAVAVGLLLATGLGRRRRRRS